MIPAEDGFFLLPLLYVGISPWTAAAASTLFAAMHYPLYPWRYCMPKGIAYFIVALWILPFGIWSVVAGHLIIDLITIIASASIHPEARKPWRRFLRFVRFD